MPLAGTHASASGRSWPRRADLILAVVAWSVLTVVPALSADDSTVDEYQVKAAFMLNLARFVQWPTAAFESTTSPLVVCVVGADPFGPALDQSLQGRSVFGHGVRVRRGVDPADNAGCHVLYLPSSEEPRLVDLLSHAKRASLLTVAEIRRFAEQGGIVALLIQDRRVRFEVNVDAAERAGLRIDARVLSLAAAIRRISEQRR
jgi:hypothetical protein